MKYPEEFSAQARARVEVVRLKAANNLEQCRNKTKPRPRRQHTSGPYGSLWNEEEEDLHEYILHVTRAYGHEACELGLQAVWTVDRIRSEVVEFRRKFTIEAHSEKGYDKRGSRLRDMVSNWGGSLQPDVERTFDKSIEWHEFEEELLAVAERQAAQNPKPSRPVESISEVRAKFLQGAFEHADLLAHWDSREELWTFRGAREGEAQRIADPESERLFKETARIAVGLLRKSGDKIPSYHVWLNLMRKEKRGFRRILKPRTWSQYRPIAESEEPRDLSDVPLSENGQIAHVFKESAEFCEDLAARAPELEAPADTGSGSWTDRRAVVDTFISTLAAAGRKITRKDIWTVAGYADATEFERFQRGDTRTTRSAAAAFNRVLNTKPEDFIRLLDKKPATK